MTTVRFPGMTLSQIRTWAWRAMRSWVIAGSVLVDMRTQQDQVELWTVGLDSNLSTLGGRYCHNLFPDLSPIHLTPLDLLHVYSTDTSQNSPGDVDWFQSCPTGSLGPHPITSNIMARTLVGRHPHGLRDVEASQSHVPIT